MCQAEATQETCRILIFILYYFLLPSLLLYEKKDSSCRCDYWVGGTCRASALRWRGEARRPMSILSYNGCVTGSTRVLHGVTPACLPAPACLLRCLLLPAPPGAPTPLGERRSLMWQMCELHHSRGPQPTSLLAAALQCARCPARDLRFVTVAGTPPCRRSAQAPRRACRGEPHQMAQCDCMGTGAPLHTVRAGLARRVLRRLAYARVRAVGAQQPTRRVPSP